MATTVLRCDCAFEVSAEARAVLIDEVRRHAREQHSKPLSFDEARIAALEANPALQTHSTARVDRLTLTRVGN